MRRAGGVQAIGFGQDGRLAAGEPGNRFAIALPRKPGLHRLPVTRAEMRGETGGEDGLADISIGAGDDEAHCAAMAGAEAGVESLHAPSLSSIICDMKFALDTDVIVAAMRSPSGASAELLRLVRHGKVAMAVTVPLVLEYEAILTRAEHLDAAGLAAIDAQAIVDVLVDVAEWVRIDYRWRPQTRDPADEMVLEAAINAGADAIVTFNRRDFAKAPTSSGLGAGCLRKHWRRHDEQACRDPAAPPALG